MHAFKAALFPKSSRVHPATPPHSRLGRVTQSREVLVVGTRPCCVWTGLA